MIILSDKRVNQLENWQIISTYKLFDQASLHYTHITTHLSEQ